MATTKIKSIKSTLKKALDYICNPNKTDESLLVSGYNCSPETAYLEFKMTQEMAKDVIGDYSKKSNNLAYHVIQAFDKKDKITHEEAHNLGKRLADELCEGKYEYVVATHIDKGHIHNHLIFNAYSHENFRKFYCKKDTFKNIRSISDRMCEEHGLNVIYEPKEKGKSYKEYTEHKKGNSWKSFIKEELDKLIISCKTYEEILENLRKNGFEVKEGKYISFKAPGQQRFCRGKTLGDNYTEEALRLRVLEKGVNEKLIFKQNEELNKKSQEKDIIKGSSLYQSASKFTFEQKIEFENRRKQVMNVKELANTLLVLRQENILSKDNINERVNELKDIKNEVRDNIKMLEKKNSNFNKVAKYLITYNDNKEYFDKYSNLKTKHGTYKKYESEILAFIYAKEKLETLGVNTNVDIDKLTEKITEQTEEIKNLNKELKSIEERIDKINISESRIEKLFMEEQEKISKNRENDLSL